jgi:protein ImuA
LLLIITNVVKILGSIGANSKKIIVDQLQKDILLLEGYKPLSASKREIDGLDALEATFPNGVFPSGAIHEFLTFEPEHAAATGGFIGGLLSVLMKQEGICLWLSSSRRLFPSALKTFCLEPDKIIFVDLQREKDVLWATEEALKCKGIVAVIAEVRELTFMQSRRLQLAVEASRVTGFILRSEARRMCVTACVARWQVIPKQSVCADDLPGVGFPRWQVDLQKIRNGKPGKWTVEWAASKFSIVEESKFTIRVNKKIKMVG